MSSGGSQVALGAPRKLLEGSGEPRGVWRTVPEPPSGLETSVGETQDVPSGHVQRSWGSSKPQRYLNPPFCDPLHLPGISAGEKLLSVPGEPCPACPGCSSLPGERRWDVGGFIAMNTARSRSFQLRRSTWLRAKASRFFSASASLGGSRSLWRDQRGEFQWRDWWKYQCNNELWHSEVDHR